MGTLARRSRRQSPAGEGEAPAWEGEAPAGEGEAPAEPRVATTP